MMQLLVGWTEAAHSIPHKWAITAACGGGWLLTQRFWYTPPAEQAATLQSRNETAVLRQVVRDGVKNTLFFGAITFVVVMWDTWWLTGPLAALEGIMAVAELPQVVMLQVAGALTAAREAPGGAVLVLAGSLARLLFFAVTVLYAALAATALLT